MTEQPEALGIRERRPRLAVRRPDGRFRTTPRASGDDASTWAVQTAVRVNVTCVTPLGEEAASTW
jgi:hypothetical protein